MNENRAEIQKYLDEINDYLETVYALHALALSAAWDEKARVVRATSKWSVPRRMHTSAPVKVVTPDAVVQVGDAYGLVAEAKHNFASKNSGTLAVQLETYDRNLTGWWTADETIARYDLVLLVHLFTSVAAVETFKQWQADGKPFSNRLSIIEFGNTSTGQTWFLLRRVAGQLSDRVHDEHLRLGKKLGGPVLGRIISKFKFTEQKPPLIHKLHLIHDYILPLYPRDEAFEAATGKKALSIRVTITDLRKRLKNQFCQEPTDARCFQLPKRAWVVEAMETFVRIGVAKREAGRMAAYRVALRKPRGKDTIVYLAERLIRAREAAKPNADPAQRQLFPPSEPGSPLEEHTSSVSDAVDSTRSEADQDAI
ncbi:MAG: hypothetical protein ACRENP_03275 [Longimicrobiales bacterium]